MQQKQNLFQQFLHALKERGGQGYPQLPVGPELGAVDVTTPAGEDARLIFQVVGHVYPRDIRQMKHQLQSVGDGSRHNVQQYPVLLAEELSPGARKSLKDAGIGFFDASGSMYLNIRSWVVDVERPATRKSRRPSSLFTGARESVVHAVLHAWWVAQDRPVDEQWIVGLDIAKSAGTSPFTVSQTLQELERREIVVSSGSGPHQRRRLVEPTLLLQEWATAWQQRRENTLQCYWYAPGSLMDGLADKLFQAPVFWAFTGAAAANETFSRLTSVDRVQVVVDEGWASRFALQIEAEEVSKGANVVFIERTGASCLFSQARNDGRSSVTSPFIQYLDLLDGYGRHKELAQELQHQIFGSLK